MIGEGEATSRHGGDYGSVLMCRRSVLALRLLLLRLRLPSMQLTSPMSEALGRYLDLASDQMKLTAGNMANVDTPGFKARGFDFEQEFTRQLNTVPNALGMDVDPEVTAVDGLVARPDGNNVSMDREGLELAKAQLRFRLAVQLLRGEFSQVMTAIHSADGK